MAGIDLNRTSSGVNLTPEQSTEIWQNAIKTSALTQLARNVALPGSGVTYDTLADDVAAEWVGETDEKPVINPTVGSKLLKPYKLARIITVSEEFARDKASLWNAIRARAAESIAKAIDQTFLTGDIALPGTDGIDKLCDAPTVSIGSGKYADFVKIVTTVLNAGGDLNGIALSSQGLSNFITATDTTGRPLFVPSASTSVLGSIFGANIVRSQWGYKAAVAGDTPSPEIFGVAGDWTQAIYGTVSGITLKASDSATVSVGGKQVNLWQRNMLAFLVETEVGFTVRDKSKFVVITA